MADKISKKEAVRRVIATLGMGTSTADIQAEVKKRFDLDMTPGHVSTTKGELRREAAAKKANPEPASQSATEKMAKNEAVYRAVLALGKDASRGELHDYVQEHFGHDMDLNHVSAAKVSAVRKMEKSTATQAHSAQRANGQTVALADILKVRELVNRVGADNLYTLIGAITGR
jgi:hypothetical protein